MKKIFTLSLSLLAVTAFAAGMKSNKVGNGSFPTSTKTTQDAYLQAQGIPPEDQARCAAAGYPATTPTCPQTNLSISSPSADQLKVGQTFQLPISGGNGAGALVVSVSGSCTSSGSSITVSAPGTCAISAYKAGAGAYAVGAVQNTSLTTNKGVQSVAFSAATPTAMQTLGTLQLASTSSAGGAVTYSVADTTICAITNSTTLTAKLAGTCTITATSAATANYEAGSTQTTITISGQTQAIPVTASISPTSIRANQTGITIVGSGGNGSGAYTFTSVTPNVCTVTVAGALTTQSNPSSNTCIISVLRAGAGGFIDSSPQQVSFTLDTTKPSVAAGPGPFSASVYGAASGTTTVYTFVATDTGGSVTYSMTPTTGFAINPSTGVVTKTASVSGNQSIAMRATDPAGNYEERTLNVTVSGNLTVAVDNLGFGMTVVGGTCSVNDGGGSIYRYGNPNQASGRQGIVSVSSATGPVSYSCSTGDSRISCRVDTSNMQVKFSALGAVHELPTSGQNGTYTVTATTAAGQSNSFSKPWRCGYLD